MNKKELRKAIIELPVDCSGLRPQIDQLKTLELIKLLDEPKKVAIPQFVADWYEEHKDDFEYNVWDWISSKDEPEKIQSEFAFWVNDVENNPIQTLVNMHQFGYEVEKDKRYIIKLKGVPDGAKFLKCANVTREWYFGMRRHYNDIEVIHTRKELEEAGFGWVFSCEGIEIEEVE